MPPPLPRQDDEDAEAADPAADLAHRHPAGGTGTPPIDDIGGLVASLVLHRFSRFMGDRSSAPRGRLGRVSGRGEGSPDVGSPTIGTDRFSVRW